MREITRRGARVASLVALTLAPALASAQPPGRQELLLRATPAVALIMVQVDGEVSIRCAAGPDRVVRPEPVREMGSGFFVDRSGWLVTSAHVVAAAQPSPALARQFAERALPDPSCTSTRIAVTPSISVILQNGRRLPARVTKLGPAPGAQTSGPDLALLRVEAGDVATLPIGDSSRVQIGDRVAIIGFPGVVASHELLRVSASPQATVTTGAVSGFKQDRGGRALIQTDASAEAGSGGGPVIDEAGQVVGVLTFAGEVEGQRVQGFNFAIPSAAIGAFLEGSGARPGRTGRFDTAWRAGLRDFFTASHARAAKHLREADAILQGLPDVQRVIAENTERAESEPLLPWGIVGAALAGISLLGYVALLARRACRNRFRVGPAEVARLLETPDAPVLLDVRDSDTYARSPVRLPRARHVTPEVLASGEAPSDLDPARPLVAYCS